MQFVKQKLVWLWQNAERILIVLFFLTFSLNIRKVILTPFSFLKGGFNEYMTPSFSWADLLMLAIIAIYTINIILRQVINPYYARSGHRKIPKLSFDNVSRETFYLLILLGWVGLSILWSQYRPIAIYRFLTLLEIVLFAAIAAKYLKNNRWLKITVFSLVLNGLFQSFLGIAQFVRNGSLGLHFLGESIFGSNIDGVAKILINGKKHIRAYGTFQHPNILAAFLLILLFITIAELVSRIFPCMATKNLSAHKTVGRDRPVKVSHETILSFIPMNYIWLLLSTTGLGFFLTFSRSAFLGLFFGLIAYIILISHHRDLIKRLKGSFKIMAFFFIVLILIAVALLNETSIISSQSLQERKLYQYVSYETISNHPFRGIGVGQTVINTYYAYPKLESWQYQPVHNIYLLVSSELGIIGFILLILFLISFFSPILFNSIAEKNSPLTFYLFCCILFSFLLISFFDHYFWDIKTGTIIFVLPLIFLVAMQKRYEK